MAHYTTISTAKAKPGKAKELEAIFAQVDEKISKLPGLLNAQTFRQQDNPEVFWFVSTWESEEANLEVVYDKELRSLIMQTVPLFESTPEKGIKMDVLSSYGVKY